MLALSFGNGGNFLSLSSEMESLPLTFLRFGGQNGGMEQKEMAVGATAPEDVEYDDAPIALIFSDSDDRRMAAGEAIWSMGGRIAVSMPLAGAAERLADQVAAGAVIVDVTADGGEPLERLLDQIEAGAQSRRFPSVVSIPPHLVDLAAARAGHNNVILLCDPTATERAAAIGAALSRDRTRLHDASNDSAVLPRLQQLSEEVGRIARALAILSETEPTAPPRFRTLARDVAPRATAPVDANAVRAMIRARRLRDQYFSAELFADPAWDMLLDLTAARLEGRQVAVSSLCIAAAVPPTTALRWIKTLTEQGVLVRISDPNDGRRVFIELSDDAAHEMLAYLAAVQRLVVLPT